MCTDPTPLLVIISQSHSIFTVLYMIQGKVCVGFHVKY